jgi:hypothetical protein
LIAETKSGLTVQVLGLGIKPFGPKILAILPKCLIIVGVATQTSKSRAWLPFTMLSINSSPPAIVAPTAFNSSAFPSVNAQTLAVFQEPFGNEIVVLII